MSGTELDLTGRVAVVTGAARGIGRACAQRLGEAGCTVVVCDRRDDELAAAVDALRDGGIEAYATVLDVREPQAVAAFVAETVDRHGAVDVLVNNAGGSFHAPFLDVSEKGEAMLIAENFTSAAQLIRLFAPHMTRPGASVINVTSIEAHQAAPGFAVYAAMKAALASLTGTLALELAERGIRVNAIAPDAVITGGETFARGQMLDDRQAGVAVFDPVTLPPLGRTGSPEEAAGVVLFLASGLSSFVTGATIPVDGGTRAAGGWRLVTTPGSQTVV
jgi:NAD(P)-dependent dehydrogenase (short-subunit alcohol dehydrogenase family)